MLFGAKTVDTILGALSRALGELDEHASAQDAKADAAADEVEAARLRKDIAEYEAERARRARAKIADILGVK